MRKLAVLFFLAIFAVTFSGLALATDAPESPGIAPRSETTDVSSVPSDKESAKPGPMQKAERGFMNAAFGWTEIPKKIVDKTKETKNPFTGLVVGGWQGSCKAFARTASGASELVTFPIGRYDKPRVLPDMPAAEK